MECERKILLMKMKRVLNFTRMRLMVARLRMRYLRHVKKVKVFHGRILAPDTASRAENLNAILQHDCQSY